MIAALVAACSTVITGEDRAAFMLATSTSIVHSSGRVASGVLVSPTLVLTARHAVVGGDDLEVEFHDGSKYSGKVVLRGEDADFAVVEIASGERVFASLRCTEPVQGESISIIGWSDVGAWLLRSGFVSSATREDGSLVRLDLWLLGGNSGAGVFDRDKQVIGIVSDRYRLRAAGPFPLYLPSGYSRMVVAPVICEQLEALA